MGNEDQARVLPFDLDNGPNSISSHVMFHVSLTPSWQETSTNRGIRGNGQGLIVVAAYILPAQPG